MRVLVPRLSGFCPGVNQAEDVILGEKKKRGDEPIFVYGYMINNNSYIEHLKSLGIHTVIDPWALPEGSVVVIRTHGMDRSEEARLRETYEVVDLTCRKVKKVQLEIEAHAAEGALIVITGKKSHPEVLGLVSYADSATVIEDEAELDALAEECTSRLGPVAGEVSSVFVTSQTTGSRTLYTETLSRVRKECAGKVPVDTFDSICPVTERKEKEALEIQESVDATFVIGDRLSSNANKLFTLLREKDPRTYFIRDLEHLKSMGLPLAGFGTVQAVSSASTPQFVEDEVVAYLESGELTETRV